jgi:hypothetical protein
MGYINLVWEYLTGIIPVPLPDLNSLEGLTLNNYHYIHHTRMHVRNYPHHPPPFGIWVGPSGSAITQIYIYICAMPSYPYTLVYSSSIIPPHNRPRLKKYRRSFSFFWSSSFLVFTCRYVPFGYPGAPIHSTGYYETQYMAMCAY